MGEYLSQDEADALPVGTLVEVVWSGGNGPHVYEVCRNKYDDVYLQIPNHPVGNCMHSLSFVGKENYHTRVRVITVLTRPR